MTCKECSLYLYEYLDNSLKPDLSEAVLKHLTVCSACQEKYQQERELSHRFREVVARLDERLHFQFQTPVSAGKKNVEARSFRPPLLVKWAMASILVGILIVSAVFLRYLPLEKSPSQMARLARLTGQGGNQLRTSGEAKEDNGTIQIISIEDSSAEMNETHFREESGGVIIDITVELTGLREVDLPQTEGKEMTQ